MYQSFTLWLLLIRSNLRNLFLSKDHLGFFLKAFSHLCPLSTWNLFCV